MAIRNQINTNFWQIADADATGNINGITTANITATQNADLGNVANITIIGGQNGQFLQTDGAGNLSWSTVQGGSGNGVPGGANTQLQYNDAGNFGGIANIVYNNSTDTLSVATATANLGSVANLRIMGGTSGQVLTTNGAGTLSWSTVDALEYSNANVANYLPTYTGTFSPGTLNTATAVIQNLDATGNVDLGSVSNITITGGVAGQILTTDGSGGIAWTSPAISSGYLNNVTYSTEVVSLISAPGAIYNYDVSSSSIKYSQDFSGSNVNINFRSSSTQTLTSSVPVGTSVTVTMVLTTGAVAYTISSVSIDGVQQTIRWTGGATPVAQSNSILSYTFTLIKISATPDWTVLGALTRYA